LRSSTLKIEINAPAKKVWELLTLPEKVKRWQYGSILTTTWTPGSPVRFSMARDGEVFEQWGVVMGFDPNVSLKYSLFAPRPGLTDSPENYFFMTYFLEENQGKTTLSIIQDDPRPQTQSATQGAEEGENPILEALKDLAEKS
jgi:uncharacterized protein YndB with AHSA1/START domain